MTVPLKVEGEGKILTAYKISYFGVAVVVVWKLDLQLPVQSVPITTQVVSSNNVHSEVYSIQHQSLRHLVRDSSAVRRLFVRLAGAVGRQSALHNLRKTADLPLQLCVGTFPRFVAIGFYFLSETLYKSLHQSFFYSFIVILPSESGVTLDYNTIFLQTLSFRHLAFTSEPTNVISRY